MYQVQVDNEFDPIHDSSALIKLPIKKYDLALLDLVPMPIFILDVSNNAEITYAFFNKSALDIANFSLKDYLGLNATHLYHGEYGELAFQKHTDCFLSAQPSKYVLPLPLNGKLRYIQTGLNPIMDSRGRVAQIIGASTEVNAEHEIEEIRRTSRNIEKELQEFIYLAAHDLRSPLKRIHMFADMLREDFEDLGDGKLELINLLEKISIESMSMIQSVLQHAETTGIEASIEEVNVLELFGGIISTLDPAEIHQCHVDDCSIYGDRVLIQTVLRNLVDNAFKHNAPNSIMLNVTAKNTLSGYFTMTVTDNGHGMCAPEKLFDTTDNNRSKSGFGLLAIRKLIKKAGGDIVADHGIDGTGLAVTATLPGKIT